MIGIDVGGANLKVVTEAGSAIHYCPLWTGAPIVDLLAPYTGEEAAVVMSGELADSFSSKDQGIRFIVDQIRSVFPGARFYGTDGRFHAGPTPALAAANWLASAVWLGRMHPDSVLLDIGSTTTDIIPLADLQGLFGLTDLARLQEGYLLYTGMLRTTVPAIVSAVEVHGRRTPVASEHFAQSGDVHLILNHIRAEEYTTDTPDHGPATRQGALRRLARIVCADLEELGEETVASLADQVWEAQRTVVMTAVDAIVRESGSRSVLVAGIGAPTFAPLFLAEDLSIRLGSLADTLPAHAVRELALQSPG